MDSRYDVCFAGQLLEGKELHDVRQNVQKLFKANAETLNKLFSGKTQLLKRGCDEATAEKYKQALARAGAVAIIRDSATVATPSQASAPEQPRQEPGLNLASPGEDLLRPEERAIPATNDVDISGIKLSTAGTDLGEPRNTTAVPPDTSHLTVAEVGEDIPNLADTRTQLNPDTDGISLSPEGTDFSDCALPAADAPDLDLSQLDVAPPGADVLEEQYKKTDSEKAPDTTHIKLQE
jgi:hypothetical protein